MLCHDVSVCLDPGHAALLCSTGIIYGKLLSDSALRVVMIALQTRYKRTFGPCHMDGYVSGHVGLARRKVERVLNYRIKVIAVAVYSVLRNLSSALLRGTNGSATGACTLDRIEQRKRSFTLTPPMWQTIGQ